MNYWISKETQAVSTNDVAKERLAAGLAKHGSVFSAEVQTGGRGRRGRPWVSPKGGLWFSLIVEPPEGGADWRLLSPMAGLAMLDCLRKKPFEIEGVGLGWPNDVILRGRKIGGILAEGQIGGPMKSAAVVGVGLNVNNRNEDFPAPLREKAGCLGEMTCRTFDMDEILSVWLEAFDGLWASFEKGESAEILQRWTDALEMVGRPIQLERDGKIIKGIVKEIGLDQTLTLLDDAAGAELRIGVEEGFLFTDKYKKEI